MVFGTGSGDVILRGVIHLSLLQSLVLSPWGLSLGLLLRRKDFFSHDLPAGKIQKVPAKPRGIPLKLY